ncbi:peptidoglycan bridge formation glycyltransferase FemA/FemB family protein [Candidatus Dojkabacteria bacterium]|uniref:Peptidoglycan bridge formation glycyltransferase FemA/FemB family protein n=1 Tax=Candidatus Dojkabacteria bacterium TaxID=2099670 RepID=A0A955RL18_9BACT|nr:peptidoglycan bridge formation glycyltransferase FemA/FemB family protein [Candidatus Dojkabacteria bacterium]
MNYNLRECTNKDEWNDFLNSYPPTQSGVPVVTFVQSFEWIEFQKSLDKKSFALGIYNGDSLVGVAACVFIDAKRGKYLYVRNGPVIDWDNKVLVDFTMFALKKFAESLGAWFVRISPLVEKGSIGERNIKSHKRIQSPMFDVEALDTWIMAIDKDEEELLSSAKKKNRYEIKKAITDQSLEPEIYSDSSKLEEFYKILEDTVERQKWVSYSFEYIKNEFDAFANDNLASLVLIKHDNKYIAGGIFIHYAGQTFYHYGASLSEYSKIPGPYRVIWEAIKEAQRRNNKFFNFWGIAPENKPDHPWIGITRFKQKFPGFEQRWMPASDLPVGKKYWLTNFYERVDKYQKGY